MKLHRGNSPWPLVFTLAVFLALACGTSARQQTIDSPWPAVTRQCRPWAYWWWLGSAVDRTNLTHELQRYHEAGMGGVHIIPIYGAKGYEERFIDYLSPKWMEMLDHSVTEAARLDMGVDMTTGTGWCFGGPHVTDLEANASVVARIYQLGPGQELTEKLDSKSLQALAAFSTNDQFVDLTGRVRNDGSVDWIPPGGTWRVYAVSQKPSGQKVKRAAPGGQGHMLNLIYPQAMRHYLEGFEEAFGQYGGAKPRAMYHDSYEYRSDWAPDFLTEFQKRRGYLLESEFPALLRGARPVGAGEELRRPMDNDRIARVKCDYRETISDIMIEESMPLWTSWSRNHGFLTRNEAHGAPANWLDLYALADIPETEMFHTDRSKLVSKFASSAAHVAGRNLVAAETGTWLAEHFTETLADMKYLVDDLFLSGVNHVIYHGTCYSPDEAPWPGWLFYASYEMNPRNSVWRDVPALNAYIARCQSVLQAGRPDNDLLLYWPIYDTWHDSTGMARNLTVHARDWLEAQPIGKTAQSLWNRGYSFDYVSDRQLNSASVKSGKIILPGGTYRLIVVPPAEHVPLSTLRNLLTLAEAGGIVVFENYLPKDVPGWGNLAARRNELKRSLSGVKLTAATEKLRTGKLGRGRVLVGELEPALLDARVDREPMFGLPGLMCIRRANNDGWFYFVANRSEQPVNSWIPIARQARSVAIMDPLTGACGRGKLKKARAGGIEVYLSLEPGKSLILACSSKRQSRLPAWDFWEPAGRSSELTGQWQGRFLQGGPELPQPFRMSRPVSWTTLEDTNAQRFAGTALYRIGFDAPGPSKHWRLDLGEVRQSARVRLNGEELGTLITPPFDLITGAVKPTGNLLEIEVTNVSANRVRDLDRRHVNWKYFYDINFVGIDYKPFDASNWPLTDSGLLGPVTLTPVIPVSP